MKNWKKQWIKEVDAHLPELSADLRADEPIRSSEPRLKPGFNLKRVIGVAAGAAAAVAIAVGSAVYFNGTPSQGGLNVFAVEINPAVCISADNSGIVTGVYAVNADADVILSYNNYAEGLIGKNLSKAISSYVSEAAKLGYLDVSKQGDAVKISACEGEISQNLLSLTVSGVQRYFIDNGFYSVVVDEVVSKEDFCKIGGLEEGLTVKEIAKTFSEGITLFGERTVENKTQEEIENFYESAYINVRIKNFVEEELSENADKIKELNGDIEEIYALNEEISSHKDNPAWAMRDYWNVKKYYKEEDFSSEFLNLLNAMQAKLEEYGQKYAVQITSVTQMNEIRLSSITSSLEELFNSLSEFTEETLKIYKEQIENALKSVGTVLDVTSLMEAPSSLEEYLNKIITSYAAEYEDRIKEYSQWVEGGQSITQEGYENYINGIIEEYGSLNGYWESVKNN